MSAISLFLAAAAGMIPQNNLNFVACPLVRDVEPPCWLVEYEGEMYYLGVQASLGYDFNPPQLNHKILVEATVSTEYPVCGGKMLKPVAISVLPEVSPECNTILPADGHKPPATDRVTGVRPLGQQMATDPVDWNRASDRYSPPKLPPAPYPVRRYDVHFDFDGTFMYSKTTKVFTQAFNYARDTKASRVEIQGYRGASSLSNGTVMVEKPEIARQRAETMKRYFTELGFDAAKLEVTWKDEPEPTDGISDAIKRRATIIIHP